jgi:beta-fructofuranosidase
MKCARWMVSGASDGGEQTQNMAYPEDSADPLLRKWVKDRENPILRHPPGIGAADFRDPSTAWKDVDGGWLMTVGAKRQETGVALLYKSADLKHWELQETALHSVAGTGMWECVDFYPVGLQTYTKYVLKASLDDTRHDHYALGSYNFWSKTFHPDDPTLDTGIGLRYDYGKFYASKSFFDPAQQRRILWGWVNESDSEAADISKGWSSVQVTFHLTLKTFRHRFQSRGDYVMFRDRQFRGMFLTM